MILLLFLQLELLLINPILKICFYMYTYFFVQAVMKNAKDRRENSLLEPDFFDSQMLWVMLRHLRADRRRRVS